MLIIGLYSQVDPQKITVSEGSSAAEVKICSNIPACCDDPDKEECSVTLQIEPNDQIVTSNCEVTIKVRFKSAGSVLFPGLPNSHTFISQFIDLIFCFFELLSRGHLWLLVTNVVSNLHHFGERLNTVFIQIRCQGAYLVLGPRGWEVIKFLHEDFAAERTLITPNWEKLQQSHRLSLENCFKKSVLLLL